MVSTGISPRNPNLSWWPCFPVWETSHRINPGQPVPSNNDVATSHPRTAHYKVPCPPGVLGLSALRAQLSKGLKALEQEGGTGCMGTLPGPHTVKFPAMARVIPFPAPETLALDDRVPRCLWAA